MPVHRHRDVMFRPDPSRVILQPFLPGASLLFDGSDRVDAVLDRVLALTDHEVSNELTRVSSLFADRHRSDVFERALADHFEHVGQRVDVERLASNRRRLISAYFTHEYSVEAAALGNPSIVAAPDQSGMHTGELRVVLSLRSVGEGHRSSISLRSGVVGADGSIRIEPTAEFVSTGQRSQASYDREFFRERLAEKSLLDGFGVRVLDALSDTFERTDLDHAIHVAARSADTMANATVARFLDWLAESNYIVEFDPAHDLSERLLFPQGPSETHGMEDARLVRFVGDDGSVVYYATYTAFDGEHIMPQLVETDDFVRFRISTLRGASAENKGIALFPRKIGGRYVALGRHDNVNNFVMRSDSIREWQESAVIQEPKSPWELMQLGNCGSPIETDVGWLVITHGVGAMRRYAIGALLLDLDDPTRVIGHLRDPLLEPDETERDGYVPNVVYSCGSLLHDGRLFVPYGFADVGASVASVPLDDVLARLC